MYLSTGIFFYKDLVSELAKYLLCIPCQFVPCMCIGLEFFICESLIVPIEGIIIYKGSI